MRTRKCGLSSPQQIKVSPKEEGQRVWTQAGVSGVLFIFLLFCLFCLSIIVISSRPETRVFLSTFSVQFFYGSVHLIAEDDRKAWGREFGETQLS